MAENWNTCMHILLLRVKSRTTKRQNGWWFVKPVICAIRFTKKDDSSQNPHRASPYMTIYIFPVTENETKTNFRLKIQFLFLCCQNAKYHIWNNSHTAYFAEIFYVLCATENVCVVSKVFGFFFKGIRVCHRNWPFFYIVVHMPPAFAIFLIKFAYEYVFAHIHIPIMFLFTDYLYKKTNWTRYPRPPLYEYAIYILY